MTPRKQFLLILDFEATPDRRSHILALGGLGLRVLRPGCFAKKRRIYSCELSASGGIYSVCRGLGCQLFCAATLTQRATEPLVFALYYRRCALPVYFGGETRNSSCINYRPGPRAYSNLQAPPFSPCAP